MAAGGGKYEKEITELREQLKADGLIMIVIGGERGEGFGIQGTAGVILALPKMLRTIADQVEADIRHGSVR